MRQLLYSFTLSLKKHRLACVSALLVGVIYVSPHVWFLISQRSVYQGIPLMQVANEVDYLGRIHDIIDGHPLLGSPFLYEYKDQWPLSPPTSEMLYALPALIFHVSIVAVRTVYIFLFSFLLFLLVYFLIYQLTVSQGNARTRQLNAIAGACFVLLGYDLVDYRTVWSYLTGAAEQGGWLLWTRPVHPISGALFLFSFLLGIWAIIQKTNKINIAIVSSAFFLSLMITSYFFSWGVAVSVWAILLSIELLQKKYQVVKNLLYVLIGGLLLSSPYWYLSWQAGHSPWYQDSVLRSGLFYTHYPLLNKFLLAVLVFYGFAVIIQYIKAKTIQWQNWHWFSLALLLGGLWTFSQQVLTGVTIWPFHFVQYTIPLSIVAVMAVLYNIGYRYFHLIWVGAVIIIISLSLSFGIYTQVKTYTSFLEDNIKLQSYQTVFGWLNQQTPDCVVLVKSDERRSHLFNSMITAFSHCNTHTSTSPFSLLPYERVYDMYLIKLRLAGVSADSIHDYVRQHVLETNTYLSSNWKGLYGVPLFPDFSDEKLFERLQKLPDDYRAFLQQDFKTELKKYRLDFILSEDGPLAERLIQELNAAPIFNSNNIFIYVFDSKEK